MGRAKGVCYGNDAFPAPYTESNANTFQVTFGSDPAAAHMAPLWGNYYKSPTGAECMNSMPGFYPCREDLVRMKQMGAELIRLYDWEPRYDHSGFLDMCQTQGIDVLVSVSNWFLGDGFKYTEQNIPNLIRSFTKGTDYHPAIAGIVIGNELKGYGIDQLVKFTNRWAQIEGGNFGRHRKIQLGHPLHFGAEAGKLPCWNTWDTLLPQLDAPLKSRLFLAPQTYNDAEYLFQNAAGRGRGYVDLTYDQYRLPIIFTEIGLQRTRPDHLAFVRAQLSGCVTYNRQNPQKLTGFCHFAFTDKVWMQGQSEGSFGSWTHARRGTFDMTYTARDFPFRAPEAPNIGTLNLDIIEQTDLYPVVQSIYTSP